jgi:hypothetical protein
VQTLLHGTPQDGRADRTIRLGDAATEEGSRGKPRRDQNCISGSDDLAQTKRRYERSGSSCGVSRGRPQALRNAGSMRVQGTQGFDLAPDAPERFS